MRILGVAVLAVSVCATGWPQSPTPEVEWDVVEQQLNALRATVQARDIEATRKAADALFTVVSKEWQKQVPTPADNRRQAEDGAARTHLKNRTGSLPHLAMLAFQAGELNKAEQ